MDLNKENPLQSSQSLLSPSLGPTLEVCAAEIALIKVRLRENVKAHVTALDLFISSDCKLTWN